jgi:WD40 repeat protein
VWDADNLRPFLEGGPHTARLITTRNRDTLPAESRAVDVDAMRQTEAVQLLGTGVPGAEAHIAVLHDLAARLGEWPLLLKLVNGALRKKAPTAALLPKAISYINTGLTDQGVTVFDTRSSAGRHQAVARTLEISLATMEAEDRVRFAELAIFPEDANIPLTTLWRYWGITGGLSAFAVERLCDDLYAHSLLLAYDEAARTIRLHDVMRAYLIHVHAEALADWHAILLDGHRPVLGAWAELLDDEPYMWDHLAYHLREADHATELVNTVLDLRYVAAKIWHRTSLAVEGDLLLAEQHTRETQALRLLRRTLSTSGHLLNPCESDDEVAVSLYSRLQHLETLKPFTARFAATLRHPHLIPWRPLPDLPHPALIRTFAGITSLYACAISPDGELLVTGDSDSNLTVWDVKSGAKRATLAGHTGGIQACVISADKRLIVSASMDTTLRVWDVQHGKTMRILEGHTKPVRACASRGPRCRLLRR